MIELLREDRMMAALTRELREVVKGTSEEISFLHLVSQRNPMLPELQYGLFSGDTQAVVESASIPERDLRLATRGEAGAVELIVHHVLMMAIALTTRPHEHTGDRRHGDWEY